MFKIPTLVSDSEMLDRAFRIAIGDFSGNVILWKDGLLDKASPAIMAGLDYCKPWTRDAAFNTWYAGANIAPEASKNTLLSVLVENGDNVRIGGQYWDAIIWATGAWEYFVHSGDMSFAEIAIVAIKNSLKYSENAHYDSVDGLFRGGACFQDGIAGYPKSLASPELAYSGIEHFQDLKVKALSSNCLYYNGYKIVNKFNKALSLPEEDSFDVKAEKLKEAINNRFWDKENNKYHYLLDADDDKIRQEGLGYAFAILFGVADEKQIEAICQNYYNTEHGIACVWPQYERYNFKDGDYARHSGLIWPQVNAAWVEAMSKVDKIDIVQTEIINLASKAVRDCQFYEIYHPETGEPYGGMQELDGEMVEWESCQRQTWCATGFINMFYKGLLGMEFTPEGLSTSPNLLPGMKTLELNNFIYRDAILNIKVTGSGEKVFVESSSTGTIDLQIG
jgi:hypothetical protein